MSKKLYVGNLPYNITDQDLSDIFAQVGAVTSAKVIMDRDTGRSKGFGFVEMSDDTEAANAITQYNGGDLEGRTIVVNEARPMGDRPAGGAGGARGPRGGFGGGRPQGGGRW